jgi:hypothetical protein
MDENVAQLAVALAALASKADAVADRSDSLAALYHRGQAVAFRTAHDIVLGVQS